MPLPNFWELSFRRRYPDNRLVGEAYLAFTEQCWPYEVQVHHIADNWGRNGVIGSGSASRPAAACICRTWMAACPAG